MSDLIRSLPKNEAGRDFYIGDIHGCFDLVRAWMRSVDFDESKDRLISVGDLIDRGPKSHEVLDWLEKPWFYAIRGNHEQMCVEYVGGLAKETLYAINGGQWFIDLEESWQKRIAQTLDTLPVLIEVECDDGLIGVVHADPVADDWETLKSGIGREDVRTYAMWSRHRLQHKEDSIIKNVSAVICGHTILNKPKELGNVIFIDTGAFKSGVITAVEMTPEGLKQRQFKAA